MAKPRVSYSGGRWHATHDCGWHYTSQSLTRAQTEARHHRDTPIVGPRWLPADTVIAADVTGQVIWTADSDRP